MNNTALAGWADANTLCVHVQITQCPPDNLGDDKNNQVQGWNSQLEQVALEGGVHATRAQ